MGRQQEIRQSRLWGPSCGAHHSNEAGVRGRGSQRVLNHPARAAGLHQQRQRRTRHQHHICTAKQQPPLSASGQGRGARAGSWCLNALLHSCTCSKAHSVACSSRA